MLKFCNPVAVMMILSQTVVVLDLDDAGVDGILLVLVIWVVLRPRSSFSFFPK